jgi:hypothetical protein
MGGAIDCRLKLWTLNDAAPERPYEAITSKPASTRPALPLVRLVIQISHQRFAAVFYRRLEASSTVAAAVFGLPDGSVEAELPVKALFDVAIGNVADLLDTSRPMAAAVRRIKQGSESEISKWQSDLLAHKEEARESIRREGVLAESWFRFDFQGAAHLIALMIGGVPTECLFTPIAGRLGVDSIHRQFKRHWDRSFDCRCEHF